jgi:hypothetical protein
VIDYEPLIEPDDPRHGTPNGYNNLLCRCDPCRDAWNAYSSPRKRDWNHRTGRHQPMVEYLAQVAARCGTRSGAKRHRRHGEPVCTLCRQADRDYQRTRRAGRPPRQLVPCGTPGAISRHRRNGEAPCAVCKAAEVAYQRTRRNTRREAAA